MVESFVEILDGSVVCCDMDVCDLVFYEVSGDFGFVGFDIRLVEEELVVEVRNIDCV